MKTEFSSQSPDTSPSLEQFALDRARAALDRYEDRISSVVVRVDDVDGLQGRVDRLCRVQVRGPSLDIEHEHRHVDACFAVGAALSRASRAVARHFDSQSPPPPQLSKLVAEASRAAQ